MLQFSQSLNNFLQDEKSANKKFLLKKSKKPSSRSKSILPLKAPINHLGSTINFTA
ncbi:MAG: hypothetical protein KC646_02625 [Candidatus Cloacimonetes bacterium]|nr:hypothetical protein [Candidatus Cloacimonadota bacterium]